MNARQAQRENTRRKIIDAFFSLYSERPIEKISIKEITALANCHRSTFYEYFIDIYDLLQQEEDSIIALQTQNMINPAKKRRLDVMQTSTILTPLLNLYEEKGKYIMVLLGEHGDPAFQKRVKSHIKNAVREIFSPPEDDPMINYHLEFLISGALATINLMYKNKDIDLNTLINYLHPMLSKTLIFD